MNKKINRDKVYDLCVIGGGPAGMMAGIVAARKGLSIIVLEKNDKVGNKLRITGGGRCNITNATFDNRKFLDNFPEAKKFLFSPFSKFSTKDTFDFFEKSGLDLVTEARNRVFPKSQKAIDVVKTLEKELKKAGAEIRTRAEVVDMKKTSCDNESEDCKDGEREIRSVLLKSGDQILAYNFALATGGMASPNTGSTGDGFKWLKKLGFKIKSPNPNIVPLKTDNKILHNISGTSWSFMKIKFIQGGKVKLKKTGKILFTHLGLSAPLILNSSFEVKKLLDKGRVFASIDLFPDTEENDLDRRVWRLFENNKNKKLKNVLPELLDKKMTIAILEHFPKVFKDREVNSILKEERKSLVKLIKNIQMEITGTLGMDKAVIADGGVFLEDVDFSSMTSKKYSNLYLLGDILNINRPSGGYSLQLCWTTGFVAAEDIAKKIEKEKKEV